MKFVWFFYDFSHFGSKKLRNNYSRTHSFMQKTDAIDMLTDLDFRYIINLTDRRVFFSAQEPFWYRS